VPRIAFNFVYFSSSIQYSSTTFALNGIQRYETPKIGTFCYPQLVKPVFLQHWRPGVGLESLRTPSLPITSAPQNLTIAYSTSCISNAWWVVMEWCSTLKKSQLFPTQPFPYRSLHSHHTTQLSREKWAVGIGAEIDSYAATILYFQMHCSTA